jgi:hypothetical protein
MVVARGAELLYHLQRHKLYCLQFENTHKHRASIQDDQNLKEMKGTRGESEHPRGSISFVMR